MIHEPAVPDPQHMSVQLMIAGIDNEQGQELFDAIESLGTVRFRF